MICEKPLGRDAAESYDTWPRVAATGVKHMCAFNYRFVPAVRLARELIEAGAIGEIRHFRARYLQEWGTTDAAVWRFDKALAGSGALGDIAAHAIDLARYLVGEIAEVAALMATFQPGREVDDAVEAAVRVRGRRGRDDRGDALRPRPQERASSGRSTARRARSPSTSSGSTSSSTPRATRASARCSSPRPTTRSGSTGGRRATRSAGSTRSCTSSITCSRRSATTATSPRTARRSRTATAPRRCATRCCARHEQGARETVTYRG